MSAIVPLASITTTVATPYIDFTSIPQTYRSLIIRMRSNGASGQATVRVILNLSYGGDYSKIFMEQYSTYNIWANNSRLDAEIYTTSGWSPLNSTSPEMFGEIEVAEYADVSKATMLISRFGSFGQRGNTLMVGEWYTTSAITSFRLQTSGANYNVGSTFELYGVLG